MWNNEIKHYIKQQLSIYPEIFIENGEVNLTKLEEDVCDHFNLDIEEDNDDFSFKIFKLVTKLEREKNNDWL